MTGRPRLYRFDRLRKPGDRLRLAIGDRDPAKMRRSIGMAAKQYAAHHDPALIVRVKREQGTFLVERLPDTGEPRPVLNARVTVAAFAWRRRPVSDRLLRRVQRAVRILTRADQGANA